MGAATLDAGMYESIEAAPSATRQALAVVLISSVAAGIGVADWEGPDIRVLATAMVAALVAWLAWAVLILSVGGRQFPEGGTRVTLGELLRTIGFAASPGWLQIFAVFPAIQVPVYVISWAWMLAAMVVAVKHALDYRSTLRAVLVCTFALALVVAFAVLFSLLLGPTPAAFR
jgi:hypothetical protein